MPEITIPYKFTPRSYQIPFLKAMDNGKKRAVKVWHRKSGKEKTDWNFTIKETQKRVGNYWYFFPNLVQARKVIWDGIDQYGVKFLDHLPPGCNLNASMMKVTFPNGSTIQLLGAEEFNSSIGGNPVGVVFSEYSITSPFVWSYIRPILLVNGGWAIFNFTPRGENHAFDLFNLAKADPSNWFCELLTVDDTKTIDPALLEQERKEIIRLNGDDSIFQQEYYCSFVVPIAGAYYAHQIDKAYKEGRITTVPIDTRYSVDTWWDLGKGDKMAVWLVQRIGLKVHLVDFMPNVGKGMTDFIQAIKQKASDRQFILGRHIGPHDIGGTEIFVGKTRKESAAMLGFEFETAPKLRIDDGIDAVRNLWPRIWIDEQHCKDGLNALKNYTKTWDDNLKRFRDEPLHNWASHPSDALRTGAVAMDFEEAGMPIQREDKYSRAFLRNLQRRTPVFV
jgi:hypothetical protein